MSESFAELLEESLQSIEMSPGSIVTGTIVDIDDDWVGKKLHRMSGTYSL